jgi:hypothetical protein
VGRFEGLQIVRGGAPYMNMMGTQMIGKFSFD